MPTFGLGNAAPELLGLTPNKTTLQSNYVNFNDTVNPFNTWTQQYLPEVYEQEVERYGNRSVSSFLRLVGAEMPMASDQIVWSEQGRLHQYINGTLLADADNGNIINAITAPVAGAHSIRKGSTVVVQDAAGKSERALVVQGVESSATQIKVAAYGAQSGLVTGLSMTAGAVKVFVFGTEFGKGTSGMTDSLTPEVNTFSNKPIIIKDKFEVSGSDASQIGWIEVSGESGQAGYLWYMKAEGDTRTRFEDYIEMAMCEAQERVTTHAGFTGDFAEATGSQGLFEALDARGIEFEDLSDIGSSDFEGDVDLIIQELDKQGAIEENMLFLNRASSLAIDSGLASANSYGAQGTSYGVFENSADMALNLGFSGFRRGSYDFYKTDWKYLNNEATRGQVNDVEGVLVPAGTSSVYDQIMGKNIRRPFLHVRYRASEADDRKMKSWVTGSVGGAATSDLDAMQVHYLSERCLVVQAANNFVLFRNYAA